MKTQLPIKQYHLIGRGFGGWHGNGIDTSGHTFSSSGGSLEDYIYWTGEACYGYKSEAIEGCYIYDAQHLERTENDKDFVHFIYSGPLVDPKLEGTEVNKFWHAEDKIRSLDSVSPAKYISLLQAMVPNIKIGRVYNGEIVWEG